MERKSIYANVFGFLAGLTNSLSIITIGVFTSHITGAVTNAGVNLSLNPVSFALYIGLFTSFIIGSYLGTVLLMKKNFTYSILFAGALLIVAGIFAPAKIQRNSTDQFLFSFLAATAMGSQNASTGLTPIGRTTHVSGVTTDFGASLAKMDWKNSTRLGLFLLSFMVGAITAFYLQNIVGSQGFIIPGVSLAMVAILQKKYKAF